jgi:hypothetical protein
MNRHCTCPETIMVEQGHALTVWADQDGDRWEPIKVSHRVRLPDGRTKSPQWTPWAVMTRDDLSRWIRLGYPGRVDRGPLDSEQLKAMEKEQVA